MTTVLEHDLLVLGAGPGGYVGALRASQLGLRVACVDREPLLGGTCLRVGCIPSKALLESTELYAQTTSALAERGIRIQGVELDLPRMLAHKDRVVKALTGGVAHLFRKQGIARYTGEARILAPGRVGITGPESVEVRARHILIATGSRPATLPGVELDGDRIGTSTEALSYPEVPAHLVVIGAGYIGLELGSVWARLGAKVTVLEALDRILPGMDGELAREAQRLFGKQGLRFRLGARVTAVAVSDRKCMVELDASEVLACDRVLVAVGRKPTTDGLGLENAGIQLDERGRIKVDAHFNTTAPGFYAVGDVIGGMMLAHKAEEEAIACVEHLVTGYGHVNYDVIPGVVYTHPEVASVGKTAEQLDAEAVEYKAGVFPFAANGRARALGQVDGRVKVYADAHTDRILGVHIIGPRAGDLIAEAVAAMEFGASAEDVARTVHAHPTLSEAFKEAALAVGGRALNV